jgi:hypothetical protein
MTISVKLRAIGGGMHFDNALHASDFIATMLREGYDPTATVTNDDGTHLFYEELRLNHDTGEIVAFGTLAPITVLNPRV